MTTFNVAKSSSKPRHAARKASSVALSGPPPLIDGEDIAAYKKLLTGVLRAVKPTDILEEIFVRDIVDLQWEIVRFRRLKATLLNANAHMGLDVVLERFVPDSEDASGPEEEEEIEDERPAWRKLLRDWTKGKLNAIKRVDRLLATAGLTRDAVMAETLLKIIEHIERIDRMIAILEVRRNNMLQEIYHHRATLANQLRRAVQQIDNRESRLIEGPPSEGNGSGDERDEDQN